MNSFSSIGGLLIGLLGLLSVAYGFNPSVPYAFQAFSAGLVGVATGGIIVWLSGRKPTKTILTQQLDSKSTKNDSYLELAKYKALYEGSPVMQRTVNTDGIIIECNQAYVKNFGNTKNDVIGTSLFDYAADQSKEDMRKTFENWKKSGKVENSEIWLKRKDGSTFPALLSANNIFDNKGKLMGSNTLIRDISEVYHAHKVVDEHERQKIQLEELKKMDSLKEEFYLTFSKECKIPVDPLKKYCEILKDSSSGKLDVKQLEAIEEIHTNVTKLEQLIDDIIDIQKLNNNKMEFKKESFAVDEFMHKINDICSPLMKEKKIEFIVKASTKYVLKSDKTRLNQVFINLVQNAIDFVPHQGGKIEIASREEGNSILFHVKDNGVGISEKRKESIFKKFYQVDISFKRKYGGSGFGLVICKAIIENLGGKIWFESKEGEGTAFYFTIPK
ncbi:MAG TPA: PAS domain-containing sensor histidine kinase [Candidatus Bathyarchaeia archaeon]|nr:PAS domain-containing sensor histidine kinase [Candidatus Bathyarchaeia archaeon]